MFLHVGAGVILRDTDIIGIFDLDGKITTPDTADFLRRAERDGIATLAGDDLPKCFVLTAPAKQAYKNKKSSRRGENAPAGERVIFSQISVAALSSRGDTLTGI